MIITKQAMMKLKKYNKERKITRRLKYKKVKYFYFCRLF